MPERCQRDGPFRSKSLPPLYYYTVIITGTGRSEENTPWSSNMQHYHIEYITYCMSRTTYYLYVILHSHYFSFEMIFYRSFLLCHSFSFRFTYFTKRLLYPPHHSSYECPDTSGICDQSSLLSDKRLQDKQRKSESQREMEGGRGRGRETEG